MTDEHMRQELGNFITGCVNRESFTIHDMEQISAIIATKVEKAKKELVNEIKSIMEDAPDLKSLEQQIAHWLGEKHYKQTLKEEEDEIKQ